MQNYIESLKTKTFGQMKDFLVGEDPDFPKGYMLFIQRELFWDCPLRRVIIPATKEAFLSFFIMHQINSNDEEYELKIKERGNSELQVGVQYNNYKKGYFVKGVIRYEYPSGIELPFSQAIAKENNIPSDEWDLKFIRGGFNMTQIEDETFIWVKR